LELIHSGERWDGFGVWVAGEEMARSHGRPQLGVILDDEPVYLDLATAKLECLRKPDEPLRVVARLQDARGRTGVSAASSPSGRMGPSPCGTEVTVDQPRAVFHLPVLTLFPGLGTFGEQKTQAVLPGVEYLENEPSSSEADVRGPQAIRRIVENHKLCFPMMSLVANGPVRGIGLESQRPAGRRVRFARPRVSFRQSSDGPVAARRG
jgi:hypothetical protein